MRIQRQITAVLLPGFGATARQPLLVQLGAKLRAAGFDVAPLTLKRRKPDATLEAEVALLKQHVKGQGVWLGRSFGGRVCARLAVKSPPRALVLLGFPVRPPGKKRPLDEEALLQLKCPTLLLQGSRDPLAPLSVLRRLVKRNPHLRLEIEIGRAHV